MKYFLITNPLNGRECDYKGLDTTQFLAGMQIYPVLEKDNRCLIVTRQEEYNTHNDLVEITEQDYLKLSVEISNENLSEIKINDSNENSYEERIKALENTILELKEVI